MTDPRRAYLGSMVATASPARLLVMLYDRLVLDLERAIEAQERAEHEPAARLLMHAQDIVLELQASLDQEAWSGAPQLASLYAWLYTELVAANIRRDVERSRACLDLVVPLADAWREAAMLAVAG